MDRSATLEAGGVIHWSTKAARMLAMVFTEIATRALRILERPFFEVDLYLMRTKGVSPPPTENIVAPQNGNSRRGRTTFYLVPEAVGSTISWRAKTRLRQHHIRFSRP